MITRMFAGLGNPGQEYKNTYHNAGMLALDALFPAASVADAQDKYKDLFTYATDGNAAIVHSLLYMNESGKAVREALKKFKLAPKQLILVHDDSDIVVGKYKISFERSSAGHKGVQSVISSLGTNAFTRIRIGIRPVRETKRKKAGDFALAAISPRDQKLLREAFAEIARQIDGLPQMIAKPAAKITAKPAAGSGK